MGLGRGLDALIPGAEENLAAGGVTYAPVNLIDPNPRQPRRNFDPQELADLAESIRQHGVLQPLIVTPDEQGGRYILVAGERRLMASRQAGLERVPVIVRQAGDMQRLELALIENLQRTDLNPLEAAGAYRQLDQEFGLSHDEIAGRVGKSRTAITNTLRLLKLPEEVQRALLEGQISEGHARAILALPMPQAQNAALQTILERGLTVRQAEELVRKLSGQPGARPAPQKPPAEISALEDRLRAHLGTRVSLNRRRKGGTLTIHFYSDEELNSILELILGEQQES
jgi:ParB family chromosome partitioning protein